MKKEIIDDLKELIEIESVMGEPLDDAPFGINCRRALNWFINKSFAYGFRAYDFDGYAARVEIGSGEKLIGILCHLDVVPALEPDWDSPPFSLTLRGGRLYGRGVIDNKGPTVIMMHVLKRLYEENYPLKNRIGIIAGCNEENGSLCLKHYKKHGEIPAFSIAPDSDFPIIHSEKGILHVKIAVKNINPQIVYLNAGTRANVIPSKAECVLKFNDGLFAEAKAAQEKTEGIFVTKSDEGIVINAVGKAGHAMAPSKGDNAIYKLIRFLTALKVSVSGELDGTGFLSFLKSGLPQDLCLDKSDENSGMLTVNLGIVNIEKGEAFFTLDFRLPISVSKDEVIQKLNDSLKAKTAKNENTLKAVTLLHYAPNLYIDESSPVIKALIKIYNEVSGDNNYTAIKSGGGTYARELPSSVAYGATFPNTETRLHDSNESLPEKEFEMLSEIYYRALIKLDEMI